MAKIKTLFLDIGGVIMTNGWDRHARERAAQAFDYDLVDFEEKHRQFFNSYETDKITLDEYLKEVIFRTDRSFSIEKFKEFMFAQSKPYPDMISFFREIKKDYDLRLAAISNEGRELAEYRIKIANLTSLFDDFFISSFVGYQKPDPHIYEMALDVTQTLPKQSFYIDDRPELIDAGAKLGIKGVVQKSLIETRKALTEALKK
jgi:putative hydrolase of the HAD superfamily